MLAPFLPVIVIRFGGPLIVRLACPIAIAPVSSVITLQPAVCGRPDRSTVSPLAAAATVTRRLPGPESLQLATGGGAASATGDVKANIAAMPGTSACARAGRDGYMRKPR